MKAAILGTTGYTGLILLRLLANHPEVKKIIPVSSSKAGVGVLEIDPGLSSIVKEKTIKENLVSMKECVEFKPDIVFAALPHLKSAELLSDFLTNTVVVDLSADFRIKDIERFNGAYGCNPPRVDLLDKSVYGLSEWYKDEIKKCDIIANPGCYPTASLLPLLPLVKNGLIKGRIVINAISGISGAGKKLNENFLFCERTESVGAYAPGKNHRHGPEIEGELSCFDESSDVFFTPHLAPIKRGIASTIMADLTEKVNDSFIMDLYNKYYSNSPFIKITGNKIPETKNVWGSNRCDFGWYLKDNTIMLFSVIDNLIKGASGQAIQNMNIRFGFKETAGLDVSSRV